MHLIIFYIHLYHKTYICMKENKKQFGLRFKPSLIKLVDQKAESEGSTRTKEIEKAIIKHLNLR